MRFYLFLWSFIYCLVSCVWICSTLNQSLPKVRTGLQSPIIYPVGSNVQLQCPAYDDQTDLLFFEWSRGKNEPIEDSSRHRLTYKGVLKIKSAVIEDSGVYYCKAINGFGSVTTNVTLQIVPKEDLHAINSPMDNLYPRDDNDYLLFESNVDFKYNYKKSIDRETVRDSPKSNQFKKPVGVSVVFNCNAKQVRWYKNGEYLSVRQLPSGSNKIRGSLSFSKVRIKDSGNYTCVGTDQSGQVNNTFHLYVYNNRKPELTGFHVINTTVNVGDVALFHCRVSSEDKPYIQWLKDYKSVDELDTNDAIRQGLIKIDKNYYRVLKSSQMIDGGNGLYYNNLVIEKTQMSDSGNYICLAANHIGYTSKGTHLTVLLATRLTDGTNNSITQTTSITTIFWLTVAGISIVFILLSYLLCQNPIKQNDVSTNSSVNGDKVVNSKRANYNEYNPKEHIMSPNMAYNCIDPVYSTR